MPPRKTRMRRESDKARERRTRWQAVKRRTLRRDGYRCQAAEVVPHVRCRGRLDPHHLKKQSTSPSTRLDDDNVRWVCRGHHDWIEANPVAAHEVGLVLWSWERRHE